MKHGHSSRAVSLLWNLLAGILNLTGRVVALILGLVLLIVGVLLSATGVLACLGVPLAIFGGLVDHSRIVLRCQRCAV